VGLLSLLFSFNGRVNRAQYWLGTLGVNTVNWVVMLAVAGTSAVPVAKNPSAALAAASAQLAVVLPISIAVTWIALALQVKRFHDRGQSGWWSALPLAPLVFMITSFATALAEQWPPEQLIGSLGWPLLALLLIFLGFFINLGCLPGTNGSNKYDGPSGGNGATASFPGSATAPSAPMPTSLVGAQSAIDRAVADRAKGVERPPPVMPVAAPALAVARAPAPGSFGRKPAR
jgi:uncharacterized membrane protein YhaH (DUF805 family)